jgi:putative DNA primase/helicase
VSARPSEEPPEIKATDPPPGEPDRAAAPDHSDDDLALRFALTHGDELRFTALWSRWHRHDQGLWRHDATLEHFSLARAICRAAANELTEGGASIASAKTINATVTIARADRRLAATVELWDRDRELVLAANVVLDLRAGTSRAPQRSDYFTKAMAVSPGDDCPLWLKFLRDVTNFDEDLQAYLQRVVGYCLTRLVHEPAVFFLHGPGGNGKGVFLNTLRAIWADYAVVAPMEIFLASPHERHPTELAYLRAARLVVAQEITKGWRWDEAKIKALTGGDPISARYMRQDFFEFMPQFKLMIAGNHKPSLSGVNQAIRRPLQLIPFTVIIPDKKVDKHLSEKPQAEWPGILNWALLGHRAYRSRGLDPPNAVHAATEAYLIEEDVFGRWVEECCQVSSGSWGKGDDLWRSWVGWTERNKEHIGSRKAFAQTMEENGYLPEKLNGVRGYGGITLPPAPHRDPPEWTRDE